jgi:hypothetical protein
MGRRTVSLIVFVSTVLIGACSAAVPSQSPTSASASQTIHVLENPVDWAEVKVGSLTGCENSRCLGDYLVGHSSMVDAATKKEVGTLVTECFVVDAGTGHYHCPSSIIEFTGRGQLVFTEDPYIGDNTRPSKDWAVIGGTGEFLGATGFIASPANSTANAGDFVITLTK